MKFDLMIKLLDGGIAVESSSEIAGVAAIPCNNPQCDIRMHYLLGYANRPKTTEVANREEFFRICSILGVNTSVFPEEKDLVVGGIQ